MLIGFCKGEEEGRKRQYSRIVSKKWEVPREAYADSIREALGKIVSVPKWYVVFFGGGGRDDLLRVYEYEA